MKKIIALLLALVMVLGLAACAPAADTDETTAAGGNETTAAGGNETTAAGTSDEVKGTIAVIAKGESHAFWQAVKAGALKAAQENGYELTFQGPADESPASVSNQMTMVQTALTNNVSGIVLATIGSGFGEMLTQAYDKEIPIVTFDSGLRAPEDITEGQNPIVAHVATDNKAAAAIAGEKLFEAIKDDIAAASADAPYVVGYIQHDETATGYDRAAGFAEKFAELADADETTNGKYKIEKEIKPGDSVGVYKEALEALYEKGVKAVFMTNEGVAKQVYDAAKAAEGKYDDVIFTGFDAGTKQVTWIKNNDTPTILGAVAQDSIQMGYEAVMQCIAAIEGGTPADKLIDGTWYNSETVVEMIEKDLAYTDSDADKAAILGE